MAQYNSDSYPGVKVYYLFVIGINVSRKQLNTETNNVLSCINTVSNKNIV